MADALKVDMTHGPLLGKMIKFTIPVILSGVLQLLFNAADVIVVGQFAGEASLAAVGSTSALVSLIINLFVGLSVGANICAAQAYGSKQYDVVERTLHTSFLFSVICGIFLVFIGNILAKPMLTWMGSPTEVLGLAALYVKIYFVAMPATMLYNFLSGILRASGDTTRPLIFLSMAGVLNVVLNLILVIQFNLGVAGVGIATAASSYLSCILLLSFLSRKKDCLQLDFKKVRIDGKILLKMIKIGLPAGIQGMLFSLSNVVIQSAINSFGTAVIAGSAAAASIEGFVYISMNAVSQTCVTFVGQNFGAQNPKRVKKVVFLCMGIVAVVGLVMGNAAYIFGKPLLGIYTDSSEAIRAGLYRMEFVCVPYVLCGFMESLTGALRGMGKSFVPMIVSLLGACVSRLIWIGTYFQGHHTEAVLYISYPASWILTITAHSICLFVVFTLWKKSIGKPQF